MHGIFKELRKGGSRLPIVHVFNDLRKINREWNIFYMAWFRCFLAVPLQKAQEVYFTKHLFKVFNKHETIDAIG